MSKNQSNQELMKMLVTHLDRIESKVDKLDHRMDSAEKVAIKQEANLEAHMKRSDLLEASQGELKEAVKPILKAYTVAWGIAKITLATSVIVGIIVGIIKIIEFI